MGIPFFGSTRDDPEPRPHAGYYSLDDRDDGPDYDDWDARLDRVEWRVAAEEKRRLKWFQRSYWRDRSWGWWIVRGIAGVLIATVSRCAKSFSAAGSISEECDGVILWIFK